jgi:hypothetical protein
MVKNLKNDAEFEKVSVNSLAIRIFSNHISWEKYERKVGLLPMTKVFLENVIAKMTEEEVMSLAEKNEKDYFKSILIFMKRVVRRSLLIFYAVGYQFPGCNTS